MKNQLTYRDAGVDIDSGNELVRRIAPLAKRTHRPEVRTGLGGFGGLFEIPLGRYQRPVLVSGTDGVGTKIRLALDYDELDGIGIDLVAMCVNDVLTLGAEPLFFLDYYATGVLDVDQAERVITGIANGCEQAGAALIGGETAEMPGMYADGDLDLAGFTVGIVEADKIVDGSTVQAGDVVLGLASSGPHSNGYSLIRRVLSMSEENRPDISVLLAPTRIYAKSILALLDTVPVKAMAHITGGGLTENLPRVLPAGTDAQLQMSAWEEPEVFKWLAEVGGISRQEMYRTFNCGIGMAIVISADDTAQALETLAAAGELATQLGEVVSSSVDAKPVVHFV
jgi:phosphoribosylformylglycinamidine cyclo-ligase